VLYHNPLPGRVLNENVVRKKVSGTYQFACYSARTRILMGCEVGIGWRKILGLTALK
jgi:hypothetical protein